MSETSPDEEPIIVVTLRRNGTVAVWQETGRPAAELATILRMIADGFESNPVRLA